MSLSLSFEEASNLQLLSLHVVVEGGYKAPVLPTESLSFKSNLPLKPSDDTFRGISFAWK